MKAYRLLRNNKESGPYSAEELIQMGLKAYDLVWIEGKSASWRYPSEVAELKPFAPVIEEQPFDRFYKKPVAVKSEPDINAAPVNVMPQVSTAAPVVAMKQPKPRIRIKADSTKIETSYAQPVVEQSVVKQKEIPQSAGFTPLQKQQEPDRREAAKSITTSAPGWKDMWLNWEQEKKAVNEANKIDATAALRSVNKLSSSSNNQRNSGINDQHHEEISKRYSGDINNRYADKANQHKVYRGDEVLETKFSQSLEDIKEQYVEKVLNKGHNKKSPGNSSVTAAILITAIIAFGVWLGFEWSGKGGENMEKITNTEAKAVKPVRNEEVKNDLSATKNQTEPETISSSKEEGNKETQTAHATESARIKATSLQKRLADNNSKSDNFKTSAVNKTYSKPQQKKPVTNDNEIGDSYQLSPVSANNAGNTVSKTDITENTAPSVKVKQDPQTAAIAKFKKGEPKIADYIAVNPYNAGNGNTKLRVQNVSDIPVDLVMIDLEYYDANGRSQKGETVYVRNIGAGETVTISAPESNAAAKIGFRISMVSSEKNNLYLIAD
jgi:hypothetical protein